MFSQTHATIFQSPRTLNLCECASLQTMKNILAVCFCLSSLLGLVACHSDQRQTETPSPALKYAEGFKITAVGNAQLLEVVYPYQGATSGYKYLCVKKGEPIPAHDETTQVITVPISSIVCTSTTHIPLLDYLDVEDKLIGFPTTDYISSESVRQYIDAGKVKDLGIDKGMDIEQLFALQPSVVMGYTMSSDLGQLKKIQELKIPVVVNAEYLEKHPLGRAEWIKFAGIFFGKEREADSIFNAIEQEYLSTKELVKNTTLKPTVMSGIVYGDTWFLPGGQNYAAKLLTDAGCQYLWSSDSTKGYLQLTFESVFATAKDADLWIGVGSFKSLEEIKNTEARYALFKPFQQQKVFTYDARHGAKGGSEFLELGYLRPDLILKDLVKIAHPDVLPMHELFFHAQLK